MGLEISWCRSSNVGPMISLLIERSSDGSVEPGEETAIRRGIGGGEGTLNIARKSDGYFE